LARHGCPAIFNTDQGAQFTSEAYLAVLEEHGTTVSMHGRGRAADNIMVERPWRSVKCEYIHPRATGRTRAA
jgi:putative transposase